MLQIYCSQCGGLLEFQAGHSIAYCKHCGKKIVIPRGYTELESSFNYAMEARLRRDFVSATQAYTEIIKEHPQSAAAYWGRALSTYGVEYQSIGDGKYRLVCHRMNVVDFTQNRDVQQALSLAKEEERQQYAVEAEKIGALQKAVYEYAASTAPYDVLIHVNPTNLVAREKAMEISRALKASGLRSFCPAQDLSGISRQDWEPMLYHGFATADHMIYVAVKPADFSEEMVFDAERFLRLKAEQQRNADSKQKKLILAIHGVNEYTDIPDSLFDGADERVYLHDVNVVSLLCDLVSGQGKEYGEALRQETGSHEDYEYSNLIRQAKLALESGDFDKASDLYDEILDFNSMESQAYWGMLLAEYRCSNEEELIGKGKSIRNNIHYKSALAFATEREQQTFRQVADEVDKMAAIYRKQKEEKERQEREQEREREKKDQEIEAARVQKKQQEEKARKKSSAIMKIFAVIVVICVIAGGLAYRQYAKTTGELNALYEEATSLYNQKKYSEAANKFRKLEDYKDSAEMLVQSLSMAKIQPFYELKEIGVANEDLKSAVSTLKSMLDYIPEAQAVLDDWLAQGHQCLAEGDIVEAYRILNAFGEEIPGMRDWIFQVQYSGVFSLASGDRLAIIDQETGAVASVNCDGLTFEDGEAKAVALAPSGESAAVVRADGTVYVTGALEGAKVSRWSDMVHVQITDQQVVGLTSDGKLYSAQEGLLAKDIVRYSLHGKEVLAVRSDGTVYHNVDSVQEQLDHWTDMVVVVERSIMGDRVIHGLTKDGLLKKLSYTSDSRVKETDIVSGLLTLVSGFNGERVGTGYSVGYIEDSKFEKEGSGHWMLYYDQTLVVKLDGQIAAVECDDADLLQFIEEHKVRIPTYTMPEE